MEALSKVHLCVPLITYIPIIIYFIYCSIHASSSVFYLLSFFTLGIAGWSITEYILHRFIFHFEHHSALGVRLHFIFHGFHHHYPKDIRLLTPLSVSIPILLGFYFSVKPLFSNKASLYAFSIGVLVNYLNYELTHYAIHRTNFKYGWFKKLKQQHLLHHYHDSSKGYGVTSTFWDKVFGSKFTKE